MPLSALLLETAGAWEPTAVHLSALWVLSQVPVSPWKSGFRHQKCLMLLGSSPELLAMSVPTTYDARC